MVQNYFSYSVDVYSSEKEKNTTALKELTNTKIKDGQSIVRYYDIEKGFYKFKNPGWILFDLKKPVDIAYLRVLLLDNCGDGKKKQPSHRKYMYRLLVADEQAEADINCLNWTIIYNNMILGTNGWQEFVFADVKGIRYIKFHGISNSRDNYTHIVNIQAYPCVTKALSEFLEESDIYNDSYINQHMYAPALNGFISNRVVIEDLANSIKTAISLKIYDVIDKKLQLLLSDLDNSQELERIKFEINSNIKELTPLQREFSNLELAMLKPIHEQFAIQNKKSKWLIIFCTLLTIIGLIISFVDLFKLFVNR